MGGSLIVLVGLAIILQVPTSPASSGDHGGRVCPISLQKLRPGINHLFSLRGEAVGSLAVAGDSSHDPSEFSESNGDEEVLDGMVSHRGERRACLRLRGGCTTTKSHHTPCGHLVILRHGQSLWNQENRFTGWMDVPLATQGVDDAHRAAKLLKEEGLTFDVAYTSVLQRAIKTMHVILEDLGLSWIETHCEWRLNERHDGILAGLNKKLAVQQYGDKAIKEWRRGFKETPPPLNESHPCWPGHDGKYQHIPDVSREDLPLTESLEDTLHRLLPCWEKHIAPQLSAGKNVLIVTHGNTVRALAKLLDKVSDKDIADVDIPSCSPMIYRFSAPDLRPVATASSWDPLSAVFLGDQEEVRVMMTKVKAETRTQMWARDIRQLLKRNDWGGVARDKVEEIWRPSGTVTIGRHLERLPAYPWSWSTSKGGKRKNKPLPGHNRLPVRHSASADALKDAASGQGSNMGSANDSLGARKGNYDSVGRSPSRQIAMALESKGLGAPDAPSWPTDSLDVKAQKSMNTGVHRQPGHDRLPQRSET